MQELQVLIVDDESLAREKLREMLSIYPYINIVGEAKNGTEALEMIEVLDVDLLFLDIQMPCKSGFEVAAQMKKQPYIVFQTAYDEYALKAFETAAVDYLLKPFDSERLALTMRKISTMELQKKSIDSRLERLLSIVGSDGTTPDNKTKIFRVKSGDNIFFVKVEDIVYFEADNKYSILHTADDNYLINDTLSEVEEKLSDDFIRVHRSYIININYVLKLKKWFKSQYIAIMNDKKKSEIPVSKDMKSRLFDC